MSSPWSQGPYHTGRLNTGFPEVAPAGDTLSRLIDLLFLIHFATVLAGVVVETSSPRNATMDALA